MNVAEVAQKFDKNTQPFKPLEQLMGVFPAGSRNHVPEPWGQLMIDPDSAIIDFYPEDFKIDLNGKKYAWQVIEDFNNKCAKMIKVLQFYIFISALLKF